LRAHFNVNARSGCNGLSGIPPRPGAAVTANPSSSDRKRVIRFHLADDLLANKSLIAK